MRETRSSGSVEGVMGDHDPYSDLCVASCDRTRGAGEVKAGAKRSAFQP